MTKDETRVLRQVPALDAAGNPQRCGTARPHRATVTIQAINVDGAALGKVGVSITDTGRFASFSCACVQRAARWAPREIS